MGTNDADMTELIKREAIRRLFRLMAHGGSHQFGHIRDGGICTHDDASEALECIFGPAVVVRSKDEDPAS